MENSTVPKRTFKDCLIPYYSCTYKSAQSKEESIAKISSVTEPEKFFRMRVFFLIVKIPKNLKA
jgi:hypothetical protein